MLAAVAISLLIGAKHALGKSAVRSSERVTEIRLRPREWFLTSQSLAMIFLDATDAAAGGAGALVVNASAALPPGEW